jgi:LuxR family maltose regulon positive regulatory protein
MPNASSVTVTRVLRPKRRADLLRRPRLLDFLHEHIDRKLIVVSAAAGYGKTSLLIDFAQDIGLPICWYTLRESDRDIRVFVEYLIASIRQQFPTFGQRTESFLANAGGGALDPGSLASVLVNDLYNDIPDYFLVVLDDYQRGEDEAVNFLLDTLLQNLPDNCHIIVSTRTIPRLTPKGMALLVARREIEGLGTNDLKFDAAEIRSLLAQNYHQHIPLEQAEALARESEGWITGILLTTHNMWKGLFATMLEAKGAGSKIYDYLANEVFDQQSPDVQRFLRGTSILGDMAPSVCNRLLERRDSGKMLSQLEERNLFISHVERDDEVFYRYHSLFQQFLLTKAEEAGEATKLRSRAAAIFEKDGDLLQAIALYQAASLHDDAARVIALAAPATYESNHWPALSAWIDGLPPDILATYPRLLWYRATICAQLGEIERSLSLFDQAKSIFASKDDRLGVADALINRSTPLRFSGHLQQAEESCREALALLEQVSHNQRVAKSSAEARRLIGICQVRMGGLATGTAELRRSLALYEEIADRYGMANLHSDLGTALRMVGNMPASDVHFEQAVNLFQELGASAALANTLNNVGMGYHLRGQYSKALEVYERALAIAQEMALWRVQATVLAGMGDVYRDLGQYDQAFAAYNEARPVAERASEAWLVSYIYDALGNTYILTGDLVRANELIRQAYEQARERKAHKDATLYFSSLGILAYEKGEPKLAIDYLTEAVRVLREIGAERDLPRVRLHLANAHYLNGQWDAALSTLDAVMSDTAALGYDQNLEPTGQRMLPLLRFAVRQRADDIRLADLVARIERWQPSSTPENPPAPAAAVGTPQLRIYGFGEVRVMRGEAIVDQRQWGTAKAKELLFFLLSHPHRRKDQIGTVFWPDLSAAQVRSTFHVTVYRLRRALGVPDCIMYEGDRYYFNQRVEYWYDVQEFERLLAQAERLAETDPGMYETLLKQAVALYRGDFLESLSFEGEEWHASQAEMLRRKYLQGMLELGRLAARREDFDAALDYFQRIARKDSYLEVAHRGIMEVYMRMGDRNAALRHYQQLESHLRHELGVSPTPETTRLYENILNGTAAG